MIQCQKCGHENPDDSKFCGNCSAPLVGEIPTSVGGSIPPPPQGTPLPGYEYQNTPQQQKKPIWIWVIAGLFIFCACGGVILAAILFPVFSGAKLAAKKTHAMSNAKMIATSAIIYSADSDDLYPKFSSSAEMATLLTPYIKNEELISIAKTYEWNQGISGQSGMVLNPQAWMFIDPQKYQDKQIAARLDSSAKAFDELGLIELKAVPLMDQVSK